MDKTSVEILMEIAAHKDGHRLSTALLTAMQLARTRMNDADYETWCDGVVDAALGSE